MNETMEKDLNMLAFLGKEKILTNETVNALATRAVQLEGNYNFNCDELVTFVKKCVMNNWLAKDTGLSVINQLNERDLAGIGFKLQGTPSAKRERNTNIHFENGEQEKIIRELLGGEAMKSSQVIERIAQIKGCASADIASRIYAALHKLKNEGIVDYDIIGGAKKLVLK